MSKLKIKALEAAEARVEELALSAAREFASVALSEHLIAKNIAYRRLMRQRRNLETVTDALSHAQGVVWKMKCDLREAETPK